MTQYVEEIKFWIAVVVSLFVKWLLSEDVIPEGETSMERRRRLGRTLGEVLAGFLVAYYGHEPLIRKVGSLDQSDNVVVAIVLAISGGHIVRLIMSMDASALRSVVSKRLGGK